MKKILSALLLLSISLGTAMAQSNNTAYILGTSQTVTTHHITGLNKLTGDQNPLYIGPTYSFILRSAAKNFTFWFKHKNYNLTELAKIRPVHNSDTQEILTRPHSELATYRNVIDVDEFLQTKTQAQAWEWAKSLRGKKIYIIDRSDFFTQDGVKKMKLIEVKLIRSNAPVHDVEFIEMPK